MDELAGLVQKTMMAGKVVIEKNAGSSFGAAIRGGDLICKGSVGSRTGIDMKGGTIIVGGDCWSIYWFHDAKRKNNYSR